MAPRKHGADDDDDDGHGSELVGRRCLVQFLEGYYAGTVRKFKRTGFALHRIDFDDGDVRWFDLGDLEEMDSLWWKEANHSEVDGGKRKARASSLGSESDRPAKKEKQNAQPASAATADAAAAETQPPSGEFSDEEEEDQEEQDGDNLKLPSKTHPASRTKQLASVDTFWSPGAVLSSDAIATAKKPDPDAIHSSALMDEKFEEEQGCDFEEDRKLPATGLAGAKPTRAGVAPVDAPGPVLSDTRAKARKPDPDGGTAASVTPERTRGSERRTPTDADVGAALDWLGDVRSWLDEDQRDSSLMADKATTLV